MPKNIILDSIKQSFYLIWKSKSLFLLLFILQIVFFVILAQVNLTYQARILKSVQAITDYISQQKLDEASISSNLLQQKSILGDDPLSISRNFNDIMKNFRLYLIYVFILFVFFTSIAWTLTYKFAHKNNLRQSIKYFSRIFIILLCYLGLIFLFFFLLFNISFTQIGEESAKFFAKYIPFAIFSIVLVYFMFISISILHNTELKNIVQKTLNIGIKKAHYVLPIYFINIFLFAIPIFLVYYFRESSFLILLLSIILMIFSFLFGRIFMVNAVEKLD